MAVPHSLRFITLASVKGAIQMVHEVFNRYQFPAVRAYRFHENAIPGFVQVINDVLDRLSSQSQLNTKDMITRARTAGQKTSFATRLASRYLEKRFWVGTPHTNFLFNRAGLSSETLVPVTEVFATGKVIG